MIEAEVSGTPRESYRELIKTCGDAMRRMIPLERRATTD
jgi:hypothetical protein